MLKGRISGQIAPLLQEYPFSFADARFIGSPIDFVVFEGYTHGKDEKGDTISVVLMKVKKGKGRLLGDELRGFWDALDRGVANYQPWTGFPLFLH